jgi:hypothetical protein
VYEHTKISCFSILLTAQKWDRLIFILGALRIGDEKLHRLAQNAVRRWIEQFNKSFTTPTSGQVELLRELIQSLNGVLTPWAEKELLFVLRD